ncbi:multidrug resistance protein [Thermoplasma volcanium GSS1]|uniref:Multidrug resistance protein n=1 Tax=Thermoplasma volcanium (strain ATCC 51530 / DSM 4299 / JCM 9571 / NBRC 15438 / GSS1) TaxID=273116 RepID=Q97BG6_THEVO|nr:MFS transporter [Thermoplasma volcanium]BAB59631.1 multidrug resistance protein [Thermoplasma volcanium GSS1]
MAYIYGFRTLDRRVFYLALSRLIRASGRVSSFIFLPLIFIEIYSISFLITGLILGSSAIAMAFVQYYSGRWTDRIGRRFFLIVIPIPAAVFYFLMFTTVYLHMSVILLIIFWYGTIITNSLQYPAIEASVADVTSTSERLSGYTLIRIMANLGAAVGPLAGGFLAGINFSYIFLLASIFTVIELFILYYNVRETFLPARAIAEKIKLKIFKTDRFFFLFTLVGVFLGFTLRQNGPTLTVYAFDLKNLPLMDIGYLYSLNGIVVIALQMPILRLMSSRSNPVFWRGIGTIYYSIGFVILGIAPTFLYILLAMFIFTVGEDFMSPTTQTIITTLAPAEKKGSYIGSYNLLTSFGRFFGTIFGLYFLFIYQKTTFTFWIIIATSTGVIGLLYIFMSESFIKRTSKIATLPGKA